MGYIIIVIARFTAINPWLPCYNYNIFFKFCVLPRYNNIIDILLLLLIQRLCYMLIRVILGPSMFALPAITQNHSIRIIACAAATIVKYSYRTKVSLSFEVQLIMPGRPMLLSTTLKYNLWWSIPASQSVLIIYLALLPLVG